MRQPSKITPWGRSEVLRRDLHNLNRNWILLFPATDRPNFLRCDQ